MITIIKAIIKIKIMMVVIKIKIDNNNNIKYKNIRACLHNYISIRNIKIILNIKIYEHAYIITYQ